MLEISSFSYLQSGVVETMDILWDETIYIKMYVSPDADGYLISPNAICKEHSDRFVRWVMYANHDSTKSHPTHIT